MKKIGSYEAKSKLSSLLDKVANGETFLITKHGVPIAQLSPIPGQKKGNCQSVIDDLMALRSGHSASTTELKDWRVRVTVFFW